MNLPWCAAGWLVARLDATERYEVTLVQAEADLVFHILCVEVNLQQQHLGTACSTVIGKLYVLKIAPEGAESSIAEYFFQSFTEEMKH